MPDLVSVVIPTRDRLAYLEQAVASVLAQTHLERELIVVVDGSDDGTWEWLQERRSERFRSVRLEGEQGSTITRNAGLRAAQGEYCLFLDDDDLLPPEALAIHVRALRANPEAVATLGTVVRFDEGGPIARLRPAEREQLLRGIWRDVHFWFGFQVGASLFRTPALERIGGFDESITFYGDDTDLWMRFGHLGPVVLLPDEVLCFRYHGQKRPPDFWQFQTDLREQQALRLAPAERALAGRIHRARAALLELRQSAGKERTVKRLLRFGRAAARCPFLLRSPLTRGEIGRAIRGE
jgi:glycosyltransferase involved in cell wall biosynthesis